MIFAVRLQAALRIGLMAVPFAAGVPHGASAQTLDLGGANITLPRLPAFANPYLSGMANVTNSGAGAILTEGGGTPATAIYSGSITDGAGQVALTHSSGTTVLSGTNAYSGTTSILGGTLQAGSTGGFSAASPFSLNNGTTLDLHGFGSTIGALSGGGTVLNNGGGAATLTVGTVYGGSNFGGVIANGSAPLALVQSAGATLTLTGANTFSGGTTINGTLQLGDGNSIGQLGSGAIVTNGTLTFNQGNNYITGANFTLANTISGTGGVSQVGPGTVVLTGANTYTGGTTVDASSYGQAQLLFGAGALPATGAVTLFNNGVAGTTAELDQTFLNRIDPSSNGTVAIAIDSAQPLTFDTPNLANVSLGSADACDTNQFCATHTFSGTLTPYGDAAGQGVYKFGGGTAGLNVQTSLADGTYGPASVVVGANGNGYTIFSGTNSYTGGTSVQAGILQFASPTSLPGVGTPSVTISAYATVAAGDPTFANPYAIDQTFLNSIVPSSQGTVALANDSPNNLDFNTPGLANVSLGAVGYVRYSGTLSPYVDPTTLLGTYYLGGGGGPCCATLSVSSLLSDANALGGINQLIVNPTAFTNGIGVTLTNSETYTGATIVDTGSLSLGDGTNNGTLLNTSGVQLNNYATLYFNEGSAVTFDRPITGLGFVSQIGTGTVTLTGALSYTGATNIYEGTLALANGASIASSPYLYVYDFYNNPAAPPTFDISAAGNQTIQGLFGTQTAIVTLGANQLTIGVAGTDYLPNTFYSTPFGSNENFAGTINGTGGLTFQGTSTFVLSGNSTYSGATNVLSGTLQAGSTTAFSGASAFSVSQGATLDIGGNAVTIGSLTGAGTVTNSGAAAGLTTGGDNTSTTFAGLLTDGAGALSLTKIGTGAFTLTGANTYSGGTTLNAGALAVGNNGALGSGPLAFAANTTLQFAADGLVVGNPGTLASGSETVDTQGFGGNLSGNLSGSGTLTKVGSGTLTLAGLNSYTGGTAVTAGTLAVGSSTALGTGALALTNGAVFQFAANGLTIGNPVNLAANTGTVDTQANTGTLSGIVSGPSGLTKIGSGTLILTAANTYTGGTTIAAGTLQLGNGGTTGTIVGNVADNGTLAFSRSDTVTFGATVGGSGGLAQLGPGTLILTGANTYTGGTTIGGGTLQIGNGGTTGTIAGNVVDNSALAFAHSDTVTFGGSISGSGSLTQIGAGTLILTGANTYTGGTTIAAGTLQLGNGGSSGSIVGNVADGTLLVVNRADASSLDGSISGNGALQKLGAGTLTVSGTNTYAGGTALKGGTLTVTNGQALGTGALRMDPGTTLAFSGSGYTLANNIVFTGFADPTIDSGAGTVTESGVISGRDALTKAGSGTLILTGRNTYTGNTTVAAGTLEIDGTIAASPLTTVNAGATLSGTGLVGPLSVLGGGFVAPGSQANPYGTLTVARATFGSGATLVIAASPAAASELIVTAGQAVIGNTALQVNGVFGAYTVGTRFAILHADDGVKGTFASVTTSGFYGYAPDVVYDDTNAFIEFRRLDLTGAIASVQKIANDRQAAMVTNRVLASILGGFNQQINCTDCVSGFGSIGSFALGFNGRKSITQNLALIGGFAYTSYHAGSVKTNGPIFALGLRYDFVQLGSIRPYVDVGAVASPFQYSTFSRPYSVAGVSAYGGGGSSSNNYSVYARGGVVFRFSPRDEAGIAAELSRGWQRVGSYAEPFSPTNPISIQSASGTDRMNIAKIGAQWTHLFGSNIEAQGNLGIATSFGSRTGVQVTFPDSTVFQPTLGDHTWVEYGARIGYRLRQTIVIDAFADGTLGRGPIGNTIHGGIGARFTF